MKRLMVVLLAALAASCAWAKSYEIVGDLKWSYTIDKSVATVTDVERTTAGDRVEGTVTVPSALGGCPVTVIGYRAFLDQEFVAKVILPSGITTLGEYCFSGCKRLTTLELPSTVRTVEHEAFAGCSTLKDLKLNEGLTEIGPSAFYGCAALKSLTLPSTVQKLGSALFSELPLVAMEIPDSVTEIGQNLFDGCDKLESVVVGKRVPGLSYKMFEGCEVLSSVTLKEGYLDYVGEYCFRGCKRLTTLELPSTVRTVEHEAFAGCSSLRSVTLNDGLTEIGSSAFYDCGALHYVYFQGDLPTLGSYIFDNVKDRMVVYIAETSTGFGDEIEGHLVKRISEKPANADNPYDFYLVTPTDYYYEWYAPIILTTEPYEEGEIIPETPAEIKEGCAVYLSYAFNEYWRGEAFNVTNRFTLSGAKSGTFEYAHNWAAHETADYGWKTNAVPELLQNLAPGDYKLTIQLNVGNRLEETDYSNNSTSIAFTVVAVPKFTVSFDLNGASGTAPASRMVYEGMTVGKLPSPSAPASWTFLGWFTEAQEGYELEDDFLVESDIACFAHWSKCDIGFYTPTSEEDWTSPMFVTTDYDGIAHMSSVRQGETIYLKYAFRNLAGEYDMSDFINRFTLSTGAVFSDDWTNYTLYGDRYGWGDYAWEVAALQNLAPGTYTLTCALDATGVLTETNEGNNTKSITFTVVPKDEPVDDYDDGDPMPVTYVVNNHTYNITVIVGQPWGSSLPAAPTAPSGQTFVGWYTGVNGTGTRVTATTIVPNNPVTLYPYFAATELHWLCEVVAGAAPATAASTYNGYLYDAKGNVKGTIQVKLGKAKLDKKSGALTAAVKANVVVGGSKVSLKSAGKAALSSVGPTTVALVGGETCVVKIGVDGLSGSYGSYAIDGARDFFASKDKAETDAANAILAKWLGSVNVMWKGGSVNVAIAKKGKAKAKGTLADGKTKVSAKSVFIIGEEWCCVPVVAPKAKLSFVVWLSRDGRKAAVEGLGGDVRVGVPGSLASGSAFRVSKSAALWSQISGKVLTAYMPDGMKVTLSGTKWTLPKAGKVVYKNRAVDASKLGENPSGLKLSYKAKDGSFKGSFKVYSDNGGKLTATTVTVIGVMINGKGYGTATVKGKGSVEVTIE